MKGIAFHLFVSKHKSCSGAYFENINEVFVLQYMDTSHMCENVINQQPNEESARNHYAGQASGADNTEITFLHVVLTMNTDNHNITRWRITLW